MFGRRNVRDVLIARGYWSKDPDDGGAGGSGTPGSEGEAEGDTQPTSLDMSDDDFGDLSLEDFIADQTGDADTDGSTEDDDSTDDKDEDADDDSTDDDSDTDDTDDTDTDDDTTDTETDDDDVDDADKDADDASKDADKAKKSDKESDGDSSDKEQLANLFAPFRANGKDIQIKSVDEARQLMQMGANYNKKMQGLKPNLKLIKMLDNNDLLDESKLTYLIDLSKKNPEAIKKLIKDSGMNPLDVDVNIDPGYKPGTYTVDDTEVVLDETLNDIRDTESFKTTMDIVSNKWDATSKKALVDSPDIIKVINEHVALGIYDKINNAVDHERMLGRLQGVDDITAYKQVGDAINAAGGFADLSDTSKSDQEKPAEKQSSKRKSKDVKDRKRSASSTKSAASKKKPPKDDDFNPLNLSDEEFNKVSASDYT